MVRWLMVALVLFVVGKCLIAPGKHTVFPEYAQAGLDVWQDEPLSFVACQYLPFFSLALTPLALLPERMGQLLWALGTLAVYLSGLEVFYRACVAPTLRAEVRQWSLLVFVGCGLGVGLSSLANQQANVLIVGLLLWGTWAVCTERWWLAAVCLGLPVFKVYPLALGLVFAVLYPRPLLPRLLAVVAVLFAVPFLVLPFSDAWMRYVWIAEYAMDGTHSLRFNLVGVKEWLAQRGVVLSMAEFLPLQAATGLLIPLGLLFSRGDRAEKLQEGFVLTSLWFVTFGPSVEAPTYLLAAPALGWLLLLQWHRQAWTALGLVLGVVLLCGPAQTSLLGRDIQSWLAHTRPGCSALLILLAWQMLQRRGEEWVGELRLSAP